MRFDGLLGKCLAPKMLCLPMGKDARVPGERDLTLLSPLYPNNLTSVPDGSAFARPRGPTSEAQGWKECLSLSLVTDHWPAVS